MIFQRTLSGIKVDYSQFISSHGKQPKGYGCWMFDLSHDKSVFFNGTLAECLKKAVAVAKTLEIDRIVVMP